MFRKKNLLEIILVCSFHFVNVKCANILYLSPLASPSHHIWNRVIINALASRGHNVTVLSPDFDSIPPKNVHYLKVNEVYDSDALNDLWKAIFNYRDVINPLMDSVISQDAYLTQCKGLFHMSIILKF